MSHDAQPIARAGGPQPHAVRSLSPKGRAALITVVALVGILAVAAGVLWILSANHLLPNLTLPKLPLEVSGALAGGGGVLLMGPLIYGIYRLANRAPSPKRVVEAPPPPPVVVPVVEAPVEPAPAPLQKISVHAVMRLLKNSSPELAKQYLEEKSLAQFLERLAQAYPDDNVKKIIHTLATIQGHLENRAGGVEAIMALYTAWLENQEDPTPFYFLSMQTVEGVRHYALLTVPRDLAGEIGPGPIQEYLHAMQRHLSGEGEMPSLPRELNYHPSLSKWFQAWTGTVGMEATAQSKILYKIGLFRQVLTDYPEWKNDVHWRAWIASSLLYFNRKIPQVAQLSPTLQKEWQEGLAFLHLTEREWQSLKPVRGSIDAPPALAPPLANIEVSQIPQIDHPGIKPASRGPNSASKSEELQRPNRYPTWASKAELGLFEQWHTYLLYLYQQTETPFETTESQVYHFLNALPPANQDYHLLIEQLDEPAQEALSVKLFELGNLAHALHVGCARIAPHPSRVIAHIRTVDLLVVLTQKIPSAYYEGIGAHIESGVGDPYLGLGIYLPQLLLANSDLNQRWKRHNNQPIKFVDQFYRAKAKSLVNKNRADFDKMCDADFEGTFIPPPVARLKTLSRLAYLFFQPHLYLNYGARDYTGRGDFAEYMQGLQRHMLECSTTLKQTRAFLSISNGKITPLNLTTKVRDFAQAQDMVARIAHTLGPPVSIYCGFDGPICNQEIRSRLVEGMLSNCGAHSDADGNFGYEVKTEPHLRYETSNHSLPQGLKQTQFDVNQQMFCFPQTTVEDSRALQLMASGRDNRAGHALHLFASRPHLLRHHLLGEDLQRVFRLMLFRGDFLERELIPNPTALASFEAAFEKMLSTYEKLQDLRAWTFVYKLQADLIVSIENLRVDASRLRTHHDGKTQKLLEWIQRGEGGASLYQEARVLLHHAYLYHHAILGFEERDLATLAQSAMAAKGTIEQVLVKRPLEGQVLFDFCQALMPPLKEALNKGSLSVGRVMAYRLKGSDQPVNWVCTSPGVYEAGKTRIDLNTFEIIQNGTMEGPLPKEVREGEAFQALFNEQLLKQLYLFTYVKTPWGKAWHVTVEKGATRFHLYFKPNDSRFPLVFRSKRRGGWEQWVRFLEPNHTLPLDFREGFLWRTAGSSRVEDPLGREIYTPRFEGNQLVSLERHVQERRERVLDPHTFDMFGRLDADFVVTRDPQTDKLIVTYLKCSAQYTWNQEKERWDSREHAGYFISARPLEQWIPLGTHPSGHSDQFFSSTFQGYHMLENEQGKGKLLLFPSPFQRCAPRSEFTQGEIKYTLAVEPAPHPVSPWKKQTAATFDLEIQGNLKSKQPIDFLYLAYALFTQGKYGEASLYLERSQAVWTATDPISCKKRDEIKEWFLAWKDPSPNGQAFLIKMLHLEHRLRESTFNDEANLLALDGVLLPPLLDLAHAFAADAQAVDPLLRLSKNAWQDLTFLAMRSPAWARSHEASPLLNDETRKHLHTTFSPEQNLQWSLDQQIAALERQKPVMNEEPPAIPDFLPLPLLDVTHWLSPLADDARHRETQERVNLAIQELNQVFTGETLADAIGRELALDITKHVAKVESSLTIADNADLEGLAQVLKEEEKQLLKKEKKQREHLVHQFIALPSSRGGSAERRLKEQEARYNALLEQARHCFGLNDFTSLITIGALAPDQVASFQDAVRAYETLRTDRKLITRKRECVERLHQDPDNTLLREECAFLLQEWRQYDPVAHPYAHLVLLLEDELNITARPAQIEHIHKLIRHPDAYIHEAMAGGKTTFLRNLFSAIESQKGRLAGVVTYSPLMAMHHKEYAAVNQLSLGSVAHPLYYHRNAPHDVAAFKLMIIYHLKALNRSGRVDQTPQTIISLNHTLTQLVLALNTSQPKTLTDLGPPINALQKLLRLRGDSLSVYSDEIDKIFDPNKDNNYSVGQATVLQELYYAPALQLMTLLQTDSSLRPFAERIKSNHALAQMTEAEFEHDLRTLATAAYRHFHLPFDEATTIAYLTEIHQKDPTEQENMVWFYQDTVLKHSDPQTVLTMQMLHSFIGVLLRGTKTKLVGTDFGRSKDGISVKPYSFSAVCQESSQRSFVLSTVLEICLDYFVSGIGIEGAKAYVAKIIERSTQELANSDARAIDTTELGMNFHRHFSVPLSQAGQEHYEAIAEKIGNTPELFAECLKGILLQNFTYFETKIEGNAHHIPHQVAHFSGSSGSPERVMTLPRTIQKHASLIRQEGAIGSVFYALLKDFNLEGDILPIDLAGSIGGQIAPLLQPGDTLIDNTPFFPGKRGIEIVEAIAENAHGLSSYRFLDEEDDVCVYREGHATKGEGNINHQEVVSIISHKGRQGTNWVFAKETKGLVEMGMTTEMTSFYQSLMRLRLLGKGQTARILYDSALTNRWQEVPVLQNCSLLTKMIWSLAQNESRVIQQLHFQANRKQIRAVRTRVIDQIKKNTHNVEALAQIKNLPPFQLTVHSPLDPEKCGAPILLGSPIISLKEGMLQEQAALHKLRESIEALQISSDVKEMCSQTIQEGLDELTEALIMDPVDLPASVPQPFHDNDATEEIEIEVEEQQEEQVEQEVSLETELELQLEAEVSVEMDETTDHPYPNEMGREISVSPWSIHWRESFEKYPERVLFINNGYGPHTSPEFPRIFASYYALANYEPAQVYDKISLTNYIWLGGRMDLVNISSLTLVLLHERHTTGLLVSEKDADFFFTVALSLQQAAAQWKPGAVPKSGADLSSYHYYQAARIKEAWQHGSGTYDRIQEEFKFDRELFIFKYDLSRTDIPSTLPKRFHPQWIEKIALMKLIYAVAPLSNEEKAFLRQWLPQQAIPLPLIHERLQEYLNRYYPNMVRNDLLELLKSVPMPTTATRSKPSNL